MTSLNFTNKAIAMKGKYLDNALHDGYYRMGQVMFTTDISNMDAGLFEVFWLRTVLKNINLNNQAKQILRTNQKFTVKIKPGRITKAVEQLYQQYKQSINFSVAESVTSNLFGGDKYYTFNTKKIEVYDTNKLIAVGFFDEGKKAIAGILNFYHPAYKKYSLGKFLMLQKIQYALNQNMDYYYTGYLTLETTKFDYKLFPDTNAIEVLIKHHNAWLPFNNITKKGLEQFSVLTNLVAP